MARGGWTWGLAGIVLLALFLRWPVPAPAWQHVDERAFILHPLCFWSGDLNPHFFNYPTLHFYVVSLLYYLYYLLFHGGPAEHFVAYRFFVGGEDLLAMARGLNALMSVATVGVVALAGRQLRGAVGGLVAGLFMAVAPLSTRFAHLAITDTPALLWTSLALYFALRVARGGGEREALWAGVCAGLAGATKYPAALVCAPVAVACLLRWPSVRQRGLYLAAGASVLVFALGSPYVLLDMGAALEALGGMGEEHLLSGAHAGGWSWWHHLRYNLRYGLGLAGLALGFAGLVWPGRQREEWVVVSGVLSFGLFLVAAESVFMRYALPLAPLWALLVGCCAARIRRGGLVAALVLVAVAEPLHGSWRTRSLLAGEDARTQAEAWLAENAEPGAYLFHEPFGSGNMRIFSPQSVYVRQNIFLKSYDADALARAYAWLERRDDLPRFYVSLNAAAGKTVVGEGSGQGFLLQYRHPILPAPEAGGLAKWNRPRAVFSPGSAEAGVYDDVDWYFVPIGHFGAVERSGPQVEIGSVPLRFSSRPAEGQHFFALLYRVLEGSRAMREEDWERASSLYEEAEALPLSLVDVLTPTYMQNMYSNWGTARYQLGDLQGAARAWEQAVALVPDNADLLDRLAAVYGQRGELERAIALWEKSLQLRPEHTGALFNLGKALYRVGRYAEAAGALESMVRAAPDYPRGHYNLGNAYFQAGRWEEALAAYETARGQEPDAADIHFNIGQTHLRLNDEQQALGAFARAVELDPQDAEALLYMGQLLWRTERRDRARACFVRVLALEPQHPLAGELRRLLEP